VKVAAKTPKCLQTGFASSWIGFGSDTPTIKFAGISFKNCTVPLLVEGLPILQIRPGASVNEPFRLSASFWNSRGEYSLGIIDNEWRARESNWDFEAVGGALIVRDDRQMVSLKLRLIDMSCIAVESLNMYVRRWRLVGDEKTLSIIDPRGHIGEITNALIEGASVGMNIGSNSPLLYQAANDPEIEDG